MMQVLVINPKTRQLAVAEHDGSVHYRLRVPSPDEDFRWTRGGFYGEAEAWNEGSRPYCGDQWVRIHTPGGVSKRGEGWGALLYLSAAYLLTHRYPDKQGVCSWNTAGSRSDSAADLWAGLRARRIAYGGHGIVIGEDEEGKGGRCDLLEGYKLDELGLLVGPMTVETKNIKPETWELIHKLKPRPTERSFVKRLLEAEQPGSFGGRRKLPIEDLWEGLP